MDGIELGYDVFVIEPLTKSINLNSSKAQAKKAMLENRVKLITNYVN